MGKEKTGQEHIWMPNKIKYRQETHTRSIHASTLSNAQGQSITMESCNCYRISNHNLNNERHVHLHKQPTRFPDLYSQIQYKWHMKHFKLISTSNSCYFPFFPPTNSGYITEQFFSYLIFKVLQNIFQIHIFMQN